MLNVKILLEGVGGPPISRPVSRSRAVGSGGPFPSFYCFSSLLFAGMLFYVGDVSV
jgi:hypothetical protein